MSKRFYLADVLGTGEADVDEFRPAVADYPVDYSWSLPCDATGRPLNSWGLVEVTRADGADVVVMANDLRLEALPVADRDTLVLQIDSAALDSLRAALARRGIGSALIDEASNFGDMLDAIARRANVGPVMATTAQLSF